jgi:hypothetical protein
MLLLSFGLLWEEFGSPQCVVPFSVCVGALLHAFNCSVPAVLVLVLGTGGNGARWSSGRCGRVVAARTGTGSAMFREDRREGRGWDFRQWLSSGDATSACYVRGDRVWRYTRCMKE